MVNEDKEKTPTLKSQLHQSKSFLTSNKGIHHGIEHLVRVLGWFGALH